MYIAVPAANGEQDKALDTLIRDSDLPHWRWNVSDGQMPALPGTAGA